MSLRVLVACGLALIAIATTLALGNRARGWNDELALAPPPLAAVVPQLTDPRTPRLTDSVILIVIDGLGADEAGLPYLDELRRRGASTTARVPYPTISRPNYVTILTGVPPRDSGVRVNRVAAPVAVDTVMDRVRAAGLQVATASNYGSLMTLFLRNTPSIRGIDWVRQGNRLIPPPPLTWPVDDARRVGSLDELRPVIVDLIDGSAAFIPVLVLDVDRAGHIGGVGDAYRAAAAAVDRMLREAFANLDLLHDTVIITADHGHVASGGHGGDEREVSTVPLVLAGRGIVPGAVARDARLIDVAPTIAALLGVPAPGHAEGRALVELLQLSSEDAARRAAADAARTRPLAVVVDRAIAGIARPSVPRLIMLAAGLVLAAFAAVVLRRRGALAISPASLAGALSVIAMLIAVVVITRGQLSPSYVPSAARTQQLGAVAVTVSLMLHVLVSWRILRRAPDRVAAANGLALVGLVVALGAATIVRAWFSPPHLDVPPPFWMVMVPAIDIAAATCALGAALTLGLAFRSTCGKRRSRMPGALSQVPSSPAL